MFDEKDVEIATSRIRQAINVAVENCEETKLMMGEDNKLHMAVHCCMLDPTGMAKIHSNTKATSVGKMSEYFTNEAPDYEMAGIIPELVDVVVGEYHFDTNPLSISEFPDGFVFTKGPLCVVLTEVDESTKELLDTKIMESDEVVSAIDHLVSSKNVAMTISNVVCVLDYYPTEFQLNDVTENWDKLKLSEVSQILSGSVPDDVVRDFLFACATLLNKWAIYKFPNCEDIAFLLDDRMLIVRVNADDN